MLITKHKKNFLQKKHNNELLKKFKEGSSLNLYEIKDTWFPPRPILEKDLTPDLKKNITRIFTQVPSKDSPTK
jgi:hypothetical protein